MVAAYGSAADAAYISNYGGGSLNTITVVDLVERKALPADRSRGLPGTARPDFRGRQTVVHGGGCESRRPIRSCDPRDRSGPRHRPESHAHDLRVRRRKARGHLERQLGDDDDSRSRDGRPRAGPAGPAGGGNRAATAGRAAAGRAAGGWGAGRNWDADSDQRGPRCRGFRRPPDGKEIWAANAQDGTISVIDASARTVSQTIQANVNGANRLKFTPDGTKVLVSSLGGPELAVFDVAKHQALKRIPIGKGAAGIEVQPDGARRTSRVRRTTTSRSST